MIDKPEDVLDFWAEAGPEKWWKKDPVFDAEIATRFEESYELACHGGFDDWATEPHGALAIIIMLDQFSRNLYRDSHLAFAQDAKALSIAKSAIQANLDTQMREDIRPFCYLPLMHSEDLADQNLCVAIFEKNGPKDNLRAAIEHRDIIQRFGRFPHRNVVLGRETTEEEQAFLDGGGFAG